MGMRKGDRACVVRMDGCMGDVRGYERWGHIVGSRCVPRYGSIRPVEEVEILFDADLRSVWFSADEFSWAGTHFERQF